jgi:hypothetical protein
VFVLIAQTVSGMGSKKPTQQDRVAALMEQAAQGVEQLSTEQGWRSYLDTVAKFHRYSVNNQMLIEAQNPDASTVAGFGKWKELGRNVRKGEKGIAILAPMVRRAEELEQDGDDGRRVMGFRVAHVFDVSQTEGEPLPPLPEVPLLTGDAPAGPAWRGLALQVKDAGFSLERADLSREFPGANGVTKFGPNEVVVGSHCQPAQALKTLAHELGHVKLHDPAKGYQRRETAELEAESVAYIVSNSIGLDSTEYSVPYLTGWSGGDAEKVRAVANRVTACARDIIGEYEKVCGPRDLVLNAQHELAEREREAAQLQRAPEDDLELSL